MTHLSRSDCLLLPYGSLAVTGFVAPDIHPGNHIWIMHQQAQSEMFAIGTKSCVQLTLVLETMSK